MRSKQETQGLIQEAHSELRNADSALKRYWERRIESLKRELTDFYRYDGDRQTLRTRNGQVFHGIGVMRNARAGKLRDY